MKKLLTLIISLFFLFQLKTQAQNAVFPTTDSVVKYLTGNWTWYKSCGGISGGCTFASALNVKQFVFAGITGANDSLAYKYYKNGALYSQGHVKITYTTSIYGYAWSLGELHNFTAPGVSVPISAANADSVTFAENCNDCYSHSFSRGTTTVGINAVTANPAGVKLFPNPCSDKLTITTANASEITSITIYDVNGRQMRTVFIKNEAVDVSTLPRGVYFVEVKTANSVYRTKITKE